jgi:hypothetical protein
MSHLERLSATTPEAALPRIIRETLSPGERGDFDREYRQVMAEATESLDLNPVIGMLERWRRVGVSAENTDAHGRMLDHAQRLAAREDIPTEEWQSVRRRLGL